MAGYNVTNNSIIEACFKGRQAGQTVLSIFHYKLINAPAPPFDGPTALLELNAKMSLLGALKAKYLGACSDEYFMDAVRLQFIFPQRFIYREFPVEVTGFIASPALPPADAVRITKQAVQAGRHNRGTLHMPGVPATRTSKGEVNGPPDDAEWQALAGELKTIYHLPTSNAEAVPLIFNRAAPADSKVIEQATLGYKLGTERRRLLGHGI
jgi:hypothetical protein